MSQLRAFIQSQALVARDHPYTGPLLPSVSVRLNLSGFLGFANFTSVNAWGDAFGYTSNLTTKARLYPKIRVQDNFQLRSSDYSLEYTEQVNGLTANLPTKTIASDTNLGGSPGTLGLLSQTETTRVINEYDGTHASVGGSVHTLSGTPIDLVDLIPLVMAKFTDITDFPVPGPLWSYVPNVTPGTYHLVVTGATTSTQVKQASLGYSRSYAASTVTSPANGLYATFFTQGVTGSIQLLLTKFLIGVFATGFSDWTISDTGAAITQLDCSHSPGLEVLECPKLVSQGGVIPDSSIDFAASDAVIFRRYAFNGVGLGPSTNPPPVGEIGALAVCTA